MCELRDLLGPLPQKWLDSIGTVTSFPDSLRIFFIESTGSAIPPSDEDISLEEQIQSLSEVGGTPELVALLRKILVFEPLQRPGIAGILKHPWLKRP